MENENIIKTIKIKIGTTEAELTPEELINLHSAIEQLMNLKTEKVVERQIIRDRYVPYSQPIWYWDYNRIYPSAGGSTLPNSDKWTISYSANSASISL